MLTTTLHELDLLRQYASHRNWIAATRIFSQMDLRDASNPDEKELLLAVWARDAARVEKLVKRLKGEREVFAAAYKNESKAENKQAE